MTSDTIVTQGMRAMVAIAAMAWFGIAFFIPHPEWVFLPLWALYPGETSFWGSLSHLLLLYAWVTGVALIFTTLAGLALGRDSATAAVAFVVLLLVSAYVGILRSA